MPQSLLPPFTALTVAASLFLWSLSHTGAAHARGLETTRPAKEGMSSERLLGLNALNKHYVESGKLAGAMTMIARNGKIVHLNAAGTMASNSEQPITEDTLFRIYSMTKPITAVALMTLYEQGEFLLSDPVSKFLPEFETMQVWTPDGLVAAKTPITVHHVLTHTAGLSYGFDPDDPVDQLYRAQSRQPAKNLAEWSKRVAKLPLKYEPGEKWHYSVASDLLGAIAEAIAQKPFDQFLRDTIFTPLQMQDTFFNVPASEQSRFATNHRLNEQTGQLEPLPTGAPGNPAHTNVTLFLGGQGLVSTIGDYMKFAEMMRNGGKYNGVRILSPKTVNFMTQNHLAKSMPVGSAGESPTISPRAGLPGTGFGLGFGVVTDSAASGVMASKGAYYWGGAAGTIFWIDPVEEIVGIGMLQLMRSPWPYRQQMMIQTYQALETLQ
ncbi:MAG: serine hydrolase domain-containing protein [Halioglobus sp.]